MAVWYLMLPWIVQWKRLEGGLSRCLTDEMQMRRFSLGGFLFVKLVRHVVLSRFFVVIFCDGHPLHIAGWQK